MFHHSNTECKENFNIIESKNVRILCNNNLTRRQKESIHAKTKPMENKGPKSVIYGMFISYVFIVIFLVVLNEGQTSGSVKVWQVLYHWAMSPDLIHCLSCHGNDFTSDPHGKTLITSDLLESVRSALLLFESSLSLHLFRAFLVIKVSKDEERSNTF